MVFDGAERSRPEEVDRFTFFPRVLSEVSPQHPPSPPFTACDIMARPPLRVIYPRQCVFIYLENFPSTALHRFRPPPLFRVIYGGTKTYWLAFLTFLFGAAIARSFLLSNLRARTSSTDRIPRPAGAPQVVACFSPPSLSSTFP